MSSFQQQVFTFIGITGIYLGILALAFPAQMVPQSFLAIGVPLVLFVLSTLVTSTGNREADPEANARKFLLGTTMQLLIALFFVLIARFTAPNHFRGMAVHFLILFFAFLITQAFFLVRRVRKE